VGKGAVCEGDVLGNIRVSLCMLQTPRGAHVLTCRCSQLLRVSAPFSMNLEPWSSRKGQETAGPCVSLCLLTCLHLSWNPAMTWQGASQVPFNVKGNPAWTDLSTSRRAVGQLGSYLPASAALRPGNGTWSGPCIQGLS
jgi:hypothetical protein